MTAALTLFAWKLGSVSRRKPWLGWLAAIGALVYRLQSFLRGAKLVETTTVERRTNGSFVLGFEVRGTPIVIECARVDFGGLSPIHGSGHVFGFPAAYRSELDGGSLRIASEPDGDPQTEDAWVYSESNYYAPAGGFVVAGVSQACLKRAVDIFRCGRLADVAAFWRSQSRGDA